MLQCISEQYFDMSKELFATSVDLAKAYDWVNRRAMWHMYGIGGRLLKPVENFQADGEPHDRVGRRAIFL